MAELYGTPIAPNEMLQTLGVDQFRSSTGEVLGATLDDTLTGNTTSLVVRAQNRFLSNTPEIPVDGEFAQAAIDTGFARNGEGLTAPNPSYVPSELLSPEEANKRYGIRHGDKTMLGWTEPVREREAKELNGLKRDELLRQDIINRGAGGFWQGAAKLGVGLGGSLIDPLNVLSAFIPVVGEARYAAMLANVGAGFFARASVRAGVGAIEGAGGAAMLEPLNYGFSKAEQRDYSMMDSIQNIAFGGVLGGGLHTTFGAIGDRIKGIPRLIEDASPETKTAMLGDAITATVEGREVRADLALREELLGGTSLRSPYETNMLRFQNAVGPFQPQGRVGFDLGGGVSAEVPHLLADRGNPSVPLMSPRNEPLVFSTEKRAQNAADRLLEREGIAGGIVQTDQGYVVRGESKMEPVRSQDGAAMTFENQRQAERYREKIMRDPNLDVIKVSDGGPVRYALVAGATAKELEAAAAHPAAVNLGRSRDLPTVLADDARDVGAQRAQFDREVSAWIDSKRNPQPKIGEGDLRVYNEDNARFDKARGEAESIKREGGRTEATLIERELSDLDTQLKALDAVGELDAADKAFIEEAQKAVAEADNSASMWDRIAACIR